MTNGRDAEREPDPYLPFRFGVFVGSRPIAGFSEVTGLTMEVETEEYQEGGLNSHTHKLPVRVTQSTVTLRHGLGDSPLLYAWTHPSVYGKFVRLPISVLMHDHEGEPTWGWTLSDAYPVRWTGPELQADGNTVAMESLELAHEGLVKIPGLPVVSETIGGFL
jgi:phage tail-like protein